MKICIFGCKATTRILARHLHGAMGVRALVSLTSDQAARAEVADYSDLADWTNATGVILHRAARYTLKTEADLAFFRAQKFDLGFVMGWQRLVPADILDTFSVGVFGMHGSAADLPRGRGRSPMNWALIEGRDVFYTNLFKYDPGVDSGDIVDTLAFSITGDDTAETMHFKNTLAMVTLARRNMAAFQEGRVTQRAQANRAPTFYPKRSPADSRIDWEAPIDVIARFIRAVAPPFNGAFGDLRGVRVIIDRAAVFEMDTTPYGFDAHAPGCIVEVFPNGKFLVKCFGGLLIVHDCRIVDPTVLVPGATFDHRTADIRDFGKNRHGGYDLPDTGDSVQ